MAQIKVHPHRQPARYLDHISQAWKDSSCSPQDPWRCMSSREAHEMQVKTKKGNRKRVATFFFVWNKGQDFLSACSHTGSLSLINPMCSCLWGVKSEGSCPLCPQGSTEQRRVEDPCEPTALSHQITCCIYSVGLKFKVRTRAFHRMQVFTVPWSLCIECTLRCMPMKMLQGIHSQDWYSSTAYHQGSSEMGVIKNLPPYNKFFTEKNKTNLECAR